MYPLNWRKRHRHEEERFSTDFPRNFPRKLRPLSLFSVTYQSTSEDIRSRAPQDNPVTYFPWENHTPGKLRRENPPSATGPSTALLRADVVVYCMCVWVE